MMGNYHVRFGGRERRVLIEARPSRPNPEMPYVPKPPFGPPG